MRVCRETDGVRFLCFPPFFAEIFIVCYDDCMTAFPLPEEINQLDIHWAAGLLEGEGSFFGARRGTNELRVTCTMADLDVIERLRKIMGGHVWHPSVKQDRIKPTHVWSTSTSDHAFKVMTLVHPLMGERRSIKIGSVLGAYEAKALKRKQEQLSRNALILEMFAEGKSRYSIATTVGCCYGTVKNVIRGRR